MSVMESTLLATQTKGGWHHPPPLSQETCRFRTGRSHHSGCAAACGSLAEAALKSDSQNVDWPHAGAACQLLPPILHPPPFSPLPHLRHLHSKRPTHPRKKGKPAMAAGLVPDSRCGSAPCGSWSPRTWPWWPTTTACGRWRRPLSPPPGTRPPSTAWRSASLPACSWACPPPCTQSWGPPASCRCFSPYSLPLCSCTSSCHDKALLHAVVIDNPV